MNENDKFIQVDNLETFYRVYNPKARQTFILLHTIFGDGTVFKKHVEILGKKYRVIVPDLPGFGKSHKPRRVTHKYLTNWFDSFIETLSIEYAQTSVYGMSLGGICLAESRHFNDFKSLIFESSPFDTDQLKTHELIYFKILVSVIPHHTLKMLYERNKTFRNIIVWLYKIIRPKAREKFPDEILDEYDDRVNLETVYEVAGDLSKLKVRFPENAVFSKVILVYDRYDPTVSFEMIQKYFKSKNVRYVVTNFGVHAPTSYPSKVRSVFDRVV